MTVPADRPPLRQYVAAEVRAALARRRMSAVALAAAMGRSRSYLSRRLTGETALDTDDLDAIAHLVGVPLVELIASATARRDGG